MCEETGCLLMLWKRGWGTSCVKTTFSSTFFIKGTSMLNKLKDYFHRAYLTLLCSSGEIKIKLGYIKLNHKFIFQSISFLFVCKLVVNVLECSQGLRSTCDGHLTCIFTWLCLAAVMTKKCNLVAKE